MLPRCNWTNKPTTAAAASRISVPPGQGSLGLFGAVGERFDHDGDDQCSRTYSSWLHGPSESEAKPKCLFEQSVIESVEVEGFNLERGLARTVGNSRSPCENAQAEHKGLNRAER